MMLRPAILLLLWVAPLVSAYAQTDRPLTPDERATAVERVEALLAERYVFADAGVEAGAHVRARLAEGAYDGLTNPTAFAEALTADLQHITADKHMRVRHQPPSTDGASERPDPLMPDSAYPEKYRVESDGIAAVEVLDGNIGYLDLRVFPPEEDARDSFDAAMHILANVDALIVDERQHGGGSPSGVRYLSSYFFDAPTHLNSIHTREGDVEHVEEFWTHDEIGGPQRPDLPLFVLTSGRTFSGAEEFAYNLKTRERATLVGETTGGGANPGGIEPVGDRFGLFVPTGRAVNPITGTNWEGVGVEPHVAVDADAALDAALELARPAAAAFAETRDREWKGRAAQIRDGLARAAATFGDGRDGAALVRSTLRQGLDHGVLDEERINALGYEYVADGDLQVATAILQFNTEAFPTSWNTYDSLGEAYAEQGERTLAVESYRRAREYAPAAEHPRLDAILSQL
jgi:tetratricopeptide (TPR) repeat protein